MHPTQQMRVLIGLAAQPLVAAAAAFVLFPWLDRTAAAAGVYQGRASDPMGAAVSIAAGAAMMAVFVVVFGALPVIAWLAPRRPITLPSALIGGALLGNAPAAVILLLAAVNHAFAANASWSVRAIARTVIFGALVGMACATVFWIVAGSSRAERLRT